MHVLFVSPPLAAPVHNGSHCLVRDVAGALTDWERTLFVRAGSPHPLGAGSEVGRIDIVSTGRFAASLRGRLGTFGHLLSERRADVWHLVFAPHPTALRALRVVRRLRSTPVVQTIASAPRSFEHPHRLIVGDIVVAQSRWTARRLQQGGLATEVEVIHPSVSVPSVPGEAEIGELRRRLRLPVDSAVIVYPGDLEFSGGAHAFAAVAQQLATREPDAIWVFACRNKTPRANLVELELRQRLDPKRVRFAGELPSLIPLLSMASLVLFPVDDLYGKVDLPVSLLEAAALGTPIIAYAFGPLMELDGCVQVPENDVRALVEAAAALLANPERRAEVVDAQSRFVAERTPERAAAAYSKLYRRVIRSRQ